MLIFHIKLCSGTQITFVTVEIRGVQGLFAEDKNSRKKTRKNNANVLKSKMFIMVVVVGDSDLGFTHKVFVDYIG